MHPARILHLTLWAIYAATALVHLAALLGDLGGVQRATQPLFAPLLLGILITGAPRLTPLTTLVGGGLVAAFAGDTLGQLVPSAVQELSVVSFLVTIACYAVALAPVWRRRLDGLRMALAIPYGAVVVGLFLAYADGAGTMLPLVAVYAVVLATMAFLSAGGNALTWTGGTLFLVSSSVLAMDWFLPGAAVAYSTVWVMLTYVVAQGLLVAGVLNLLPSRRWSERLPGAALVIVES